MGKPRSRIAWLSHPSPLRRQPGSVPGAPGPAGAYPLSYLPLARWTARPEDYKCGARSLAA
ncbi:hypothetical protein I79_013327 [Cricetulus griseus]|uniref:Uncharacterized protein n=1 Tax=Cricetulus griseus TaxID=10029 RepID=G3HR64_CRIGR|nr:hypothetical protein I79_013327 [Cricetulus griseus]